MKLHVSILKLTLLALFALVYSTTVVAQNDYSLGPSNNSIESQEAEDSSALDDATPADDFPSDGSTSLFNDEPASNSLSAPVEPPKNNAVTKNAASPQGKTKPVPVKKSTPVVAEPQNKAAPIQTGIPTNPVANLAPITIPSENAAPLNIAPTTSTPVVPVQIPVVPPTTIAQPAPPPVAPLTTDGSIAPVRQVNPLPANDFAGVPPMPGSRRNLAHGEAPETYNVEMGDTLFDVCSQLIDDGNYWPRLWSLNPDIKNPHFIYPGMKLAFFGGDPFNPPYVEIVEEDEMVPVDKGPLKEEELIAQEIEIPKTTSNLTPSEEGVEVIGPENLEDDGSLAELFEYVGTTYTRDDMIFTLPAFIFPEEQEELGVIDGGYLGEIIAGDGVTVRIMDAPNLVPGQVYTVLRARGEVRNPNTNDRVGYRYDFAGNIKIGTKKDDEVYDGVVQNNFIGLKPGDVLVNFKSTRRSIDNWHYIGPIGNAAASIVSMNLFTQSFAGEGGLVYLDKGGMSPGSFFSVFQKSAYSGIPGQRSSTDDAAMRRVGVVRVIDSTPNSTVAVVVKNSSEIRLGDTLSLQ